MASIVSHLFPGCCGYTMYTVSNVTDKDSWDSIRASIRLRSTNIARAAIKISRADFENLGNKLPYRCDLVTSDRDSLLLNLFVRVEILKKTLW